MLREEHYIAHLYSARIKYIWIIFEGGIPLSEVGYIEVFSYTSVAQLPLEDVAIAITDENNTVIAMRLTNRNGLTEQVPISVPNSSAGLTPDTGIIPYTKVNLYARREGFEQIENLNLQVFPGLVTRINLEMIPLAELPFNWDKANVYQTPSQNL
jgi:hypothetical protein